MRKRARILYGLLGLVLVALTAPYGLELARSASPPLNPLREFIGVGRVTAFQRLWPTSRCRITIELVQWSSVAGFTLRDLPQAGERYVMYAAPPACGCLRPAPAPEAASPWAFRAIQSPSGLWYLELYRPPPACREVRLHE